MKRKIRDIFEGQEHLLKGTESVLTDEVLNAEISENFFLKMKQISEYKPEKQTVVKWDKQSKKLWKDFDKLCKKNLLEPVNRENWSLAADVAMSYACKLAIVEDYKNPMIIEKQMQWSIDYVKSAILDGYTIKKF